MNTEHLPFSQAAENNKAHILNVLRTAFANVKSVLEIGSGTGQHGQHFAAHLPHIVWQTSDLGENLAGLQARVTAAGLANLPHPVELDVASRAWPIEQVDAIFSANAVHIMSWPNVEHMFKGIGRTLNRGGMLCLYGPYKYDGAFTTDSNARFDLWLKDRDPSSGIRDFENTNALANAQSLTLTADHPMPANNQLLVWQGM